MPFLKFDCLYQFLKLYCSPVQAIDNELLFLLGLEVYSVSCISPAQQSTGWSHHLKSNFFCKVCHQMRLSHFCSAFMRLQFIYSVWEWKSPVGKIEVIEIVAGW